MNENSVTPLMIACSLGSRKVVEWLLDHGAKVDAATILKDPYKYPEAGNCTALLMACSRARLDIVRLLVERRADVNRQDSRGNTPLLVACAHGQLEIAGFLIDKGANINHENGPGATALLIAIQQDEQAVARYLMSCGANVNASFANGRNALRVAAERGNASLVGALIEKGADVSATNASAALLEAAIEGHTEVVALLIQKGAVLDAQDEEGWTPLMKAAALGRVNTVKALCDAGADPAKRNKFGRTALEYARGIPGTEHLATTEDLRNGAERGLFQQEELWYVLARKSSDSAADYDRITTMLENYEKRFHNKRAGVDAGFRGLFAFERQWSGTTQLERSA